MPRNNPEKEKWEKNYKQYRYYLGKAATSHIVAALMALFAYGSSFALIIIGFPGSFQHDIFGTAYGLVLVVGLVLNFVSPMFYIECFNSYAREKAGLRKKYGIKDQ